MLYNGHVAAVRGGHGPGLNTLCAKRVLELILGLKGYYIKVSGFMSNTPYFSG